MNAPRRPGFTLVELIVVVVVLAITAGIVLPRMVGRERREAEQSARVIRDALSAAARRESLTSEPVAIDFDAQNAVLAVLTPIPGAPGDWSRAIVWRPDPMTPLAPLGSLELVKAVADDVALPEGRWRVVMQGAERRPGLRLTVRAPVTGQSWTINLPPEAGAASIAEGDTAGVGEGIDLDRSGLRDATW